MKDSAEAPSGPDDAKKREIMQAMVEILKRVILLLQIKEALEAKEMTNAAADAEAESADTSPDQQVCDCPVEQPQANLQDFTTEPQPLQESQLGSNVDLTPAPNSSVNDSPFTNHNVVESGNDLQEDLLIEAHILVFQQTAEDIFSLFLQKSSDDVLLAFFGKETIENFHVREHFLDQLHSNADEFQGFTFADAGIAILIGVLKYFLKKKLARQHGEDTPKYIAAEYAFDVLFALATSQIVAARTGSGHLALANFTIEMGAIAVDRTVRAVEKYKEARSVWENAGIGLGGWLKSLVKLRNQIRVREALGLPPHQSMLDAYESGVQDIKQTLRNDWNLNENSADMIDKLLESEKLMSEGDLIGAENARAEAVQFAHDQDYWIDNPLEALTGPFGYSLGGVFDGNPYSGDHGHVMNQIMIGLGY